MAIIEMKVPTIGESVTEVTLSQWLVEDGSYVKIDQPICEFESDKATLEFPAEAAGTIKYISAEGDDIEIGGIVATIDTSASAPAEEAAPAKAAAPPPEPAKAAPPPEPQKATYAAGHASPAAAKIMKENDLAAQDVSGTGKDGRITKDDALKASKNKPATPSPSQSSAAPAQPSVAFSRNTRKEKMSRMRRTIASRLVEAKNNTAMLTTFNEVDLTNIIALRKKYQEQFVEKHGIKLGFMSLFAKACAKVLVEMPQINAQIDGNEIIYNDFVDISVAISTDNGLVVPPVHNVESLHFADIERKIKELAVKARDGSLTLDEMRGGTFTITNGGIFGSMMSTPILNRPQSAILGMHTIKERPIAVDGEVQIRPMMYLALSYDHRIIDGSSSVTFLVKVVKLLEDPTTLLLDL